MGQKFLIDTNAILDYLRCKLPTSGEKLMNEILDSSPQVSVITEVELLGFNNSKDDEALLAQFFDGATIYSITKSEVKCCIEIRKKHTIKLPDAFIAATALVHNLTLITRNTSDFDKIAGLKIINPHLL